MIIAGPILDPAPREFIGDNRVAVPRSFFKVILAPYANPVRAIGFVMPNSKVKGGMQAAAVSVDKVEELTGYDFCSTARLDRKMLWKQMLTSRFGAE